ncbi:MAG: PEP-CTERM sorting domain-containing protein [Vicinamibacterales bacterium]
MSIRASVISTVLGVALIAATPAHAAPINFVQNGDFSAGNTGFYSGYSFHDNDDGGYAPGNYSIESVANPWNRSFVETGDHTTGNGYMFVGNGSESPEIVWQQTVSGLSFDTDYYFEAFLMNLCCLDRVLPGPQLQFFANDVLLGTGATDTPGLWTGISNVWNSGSLSSVTLSLKNASLVWDGNDFAIDDVFLGTESTVNPTPVPEPASMLLVGTGIAAMMRRRYRSQAQ